MNLNEAKSKLSKVGQEHILKYYDELSEIEKESLIDQIDLVDFSVLESISNKDSATRKGVITPIEAMDLAEIDSKREEYEEIGLRAISNGEVGAVLLAGGMGTRLGSDDPKGMYNIGITKDVFIFERIIANLMEVVNRTGSYIHLFIMTSDKNHTRTTDFLKEKNYFGYSKDFIHFFRQGMAPASDYKGKVFMEEKGKIACSPNGNGGWYSSMATNGILDTIKRSGIKWLNVFAVDNVLQRIADPSFIGATIAKNCSVGAKVVRKCSPDEKVGVMCLEDGRPSIVEYYELTEAMINEKNDKGEPAYNFGVILNYLFKVEDLDNILDKEMPYHLVEKKIQYIDDNGMIIKPTEPNGYKFEVLILDMIHLMDSCLPYEVIREKEFAPIKNRSGVDSVDTARELCKLNGIEL